MIEQYLSGGAVISLVILCWKMNRDTNGKFVRKKECDIARTSIGDKTDEIKDNINQRIDDIKSHIDTRFRDLQRYLSENGFKK